MQDYWPTTDEERSNNAFFSSLLCWGDCIFLVVRTAWDCNAGWCGTALSVGRERRRMMHPAHPPADLKTTTTFFERTSVSEKHLTRIFKEGSQDHPFVSPQQKGAPNNQTHEISFFLLPSLFLLSLLHPIIAFTSFLHSSISPKIKFSPIKSWAQSPIIIFSIHHG